MSFIQVDSLVLEKLKHLVEEYVLIRWIIFTIASNIYFIQVGERLVI